MNAKEYLMGLPLKELRRRQTINQLQQAAAYKQRRIDILELLQQRHNILTAIVYLKTK